MFRVVDYYESRFGETVYVSDDIRDCHDFCNQYEEDTDGENNLIIITPDGQRIEPEILVCD